MSIFASEMLNDMCDTYDMYDTFSKQNGLKHFLTKSLKRNAFLCYEKFVPLQCRNE